MKPKLRVTQIKSTIGETRSFGTTLVALGLRRVGATVVVDNTPSFRGAIKKVMHLITVEEADRG